MIIQGQVGPIGQTQSLTPGTQPNIRLGNMGDQIVSELHGRYYEAAYRRSLFHAAIAGQVTTVGLATTHTGLTLSNPVGSLVNLVVTKFGWGFGVAFVAAAGIGLAIGYNATTNVTHTTPVTVRSNYVGIGAAGSGLVDSSSTLPTAPTIHSIVGVGLTGAITTVPSIPMSWIDLEGSIVIPAGGYICTYTSTASGAASGYFSFQWEEVPV